MKKREDRIVKINGLRKCCYMIGLFVICFICTACGKREPATIKDDLKNELLVYNTNFEMKDYEITQSMTEGKNYSASAVVQAKNSFAEIKLTADFYYTKYDQGWKIDYCSFTLVDYEIIKDLDEEYISKLYEKRNMEHGDKVTYYEITEMTKESLVACGTFNSENGKYLNIKGEVETTWKYDINQDEWVFEQESTNFYNILDYDVQGTWKQYDSDKYIYIKKQNEIEFDVKVEGIVDLPEEWVHVELAKQDEDSKQAAVYKGVASNGKTLTVKFSPDRNSEFRVFVEIPGWFNSRWSFLRNFTPSK